MPDNAICRSFRRPSVVRCASRGHISKTKQDRSSKEIEDTVQDRDIVTME